MDSFLTSDPTGFYLWEDEPIWSRTDNRWWLAGNFTRREITQREAERIMRRKIHTKECIDLKTKASTIICM